MYSFYRLMWRVASLKLNSAFVLCLIDLSTQTQQVMHICSLSGLLVNFRLRVNTISESPNVVIDSFASSDLINSLGHNLSLIEV